jgi:hypothetical protein
MRNFFKPLKPQALALARGKPMLPQTCQSITHSVVCAAKRSLALGLALLLAVAALLGACGGGSHSAGRTPGDPAGQRRIHRCTGCRSGLCDTLR